MDELSKPLVVRERAAGGRRMGSAVIGMALACAVVVAAAGYVGLYGNKLGGEPHAIARIDRQIVTGSVQPAPAAAEPPRQKERETAGEVEEVAGVRVIRGNGGRAPDSIVIKVPSETGETQIASLDRRLTERGRHGLLPKLDAAAGAPRDYYARPFNAAAARGKPQIAVVVTGLGIGASATAEAIAKLPADVTFAFAPYGNDLDKQSQRARDAGHELLLQVPMEPHGYPQNDSGPHTLLSDGEAQNMDKLHWVMSRVQGYVGITNFMGARFLTVRPALKPVLDDMARRGLMFVEDGSVANSLVAEVASTASLPVARGTVLLDGLDKGGDFDAALQRAEASARSGAPAIVMGPALPTTIERINRWARSLQGKGIVLVPVSALVGRKGA